MEGCLIGDNKAKPSQLKPWLSQIMHHQHDSEWMLREFSAFSFIEAHVNVQIYIYIILTLNRITSVIELNCHAPGTKPGP